MLSERSRNSRCHYLFDTAKIQHRDSGCQVFGQLFLGIIALFFSIREKNIRSYSILSIQLNKNQLKTWLLKKGMFNFV